MKENIIPHFVLPSKILFCVNKRIFFYLTKIKLTKTIEAAFVCILVDNFIFNSHMVYRFQREFNPILKTRVAEKKSQSRQSCSLR